MSRPKFIASLLLAAAVAMPASWSLGEETAPGAGKKEASKTAPEKSKTAASPQEQKVLIASNMPVFVPPNRGAPPMRLGGATRSARKPAHELPRMEALVPEEPGWTLQAQPVLYWYLDHTTNVAVEFGVQRVDPLQQVVRKSLPTPKQAGIQRIDLADYGVQLEPGPIYFWFVKLVPDPKDPEQDKIVGGGIRRVSADPELAAELAKPDTSKPHALAHAGIWYDAVDAYSRAIDAQPQDKALRDQRTALLKQVDIQLDGSPR